MCEIPPLETATLRFNNNSETQSNTTRTTAEMLQEIKSIIRGEEVKLRNRKQQKENCTAQQEVAIRGLMIAKEQQRMKKHFKRGNHEPHAAQELEDYTQSTLREHPRFKSAENSQYLPHENSARSKGFCRSLIRDNVSQNSFNLSHNKGQFKGLQTTKVSDQVKILFTLPDKYRTKKNISCRRDEPSRVLGRFSSRHGSQDRDELQRPSLTEVINIGKSRAEFHSGEQSHCSSQMSRVVTSVDNRTIASQQHQEEGCNATLRSAREINNSQDKENTRRKRKNFKKMAVMEPAFITNLVGDELPDIRQEKPSMDPENSNITTIALPPSHQTSILLDSSEQVESEEATKLLKHLSLGMEYVNLFKARQMDLQLNSAIDQQFARFMQLINEQQSNKLVLKEQGYGVYSAIALAKILRSQTRITHLDLSMNALSAGLDDLLTGIFHAESLVCLKLRNNKLDGRRCQQFLFNLFRDHQTLTAIDLGNSDHIKNRNRLHNEGFAAIVEGILHTPGSSVVSELHLQYAFITSEGLQMLQALSPSHLDLQVLDLANNDLGDLACMNLKNLVDGLVHLNLSNTKMGNRGCIELTKMIQLRTKDAPQKSKLKILDISQNSIGRDGLNMLFNKLRLHETIQSLNVAYNDMILGDKLISLVEFLYKNKSCTSLNLAGNSLRPGDMVFMSQGLQRNTCLCKLNLSDNGFEERAGLDYLCQGLVKAKAKTKLVELDLQRCNISGESVLPLADLLNSKFQLRSLNLKDNAIDDLGAQQLGAAIKINPFLCGIHLEMNPARLNITKAIYAMAVHNTQRVTNFEVQKYLAERKDVKAATTESLIDCCFDQRIREHVIQNLPKLSGHVVRSLTKPLSISDRTQLARYTSGLPERNRPSSICFDEHSLYRLDMLPRVSRKALLQEVRSFSSLDVHGIISDVLHYSKELKSETKHTKQDCQDLQIAKETILQESRSEFEGLLAQKEMLIDEKRELDFEIIMKDEQVVRSKTRGEKRIVEMRQKTLVISESNSKFDIQYKDLCEDLVLKDRKFDPLREEIALELEKAEQKDRITQIIYGTYLSEYERIQDLADASTSKSRAEGATAALEANESVTLQTAKEKIAQRKQKSSVGRPIKLAVKAVAKESPIKSPTKFIPFSFDDGTQPSPHKLQHSTSSPIKILAREMKDRLAAARRSSEANPFNLEKCTQQFIEEDSEDASVNLRLKVQKAN